MQFIYIPWNLLTTAHMVKHEPGELDTLFYDY